MPLIDSLIEAILLVICLAGFFLVPDQAVTRPLWPLLAGAGLLVLVGLRWLRRKTFTDDSFAPGMGGILLATFGIVMFANHQRFLPAMLIALAVSLAAGLAWSAWKASHAGH